MQLVSKRNFIILLSAILVIALAIMALYMTSKPQKETKKVLTEKEKEIQQIETQSNSDEVEDIEEDLNNTDLIDIDKELQDIENEIEAATY